MSGSSIGKSLENDIKNFVQYSRERHNSVENLPVQADLQSLNGGNAMLNIVDESESQVDDAQIYNINIQPAQVFD